MVFSNRIIQTVILIFFCSTGNAQKTLPEYAKVLAQASDDEHFNRTLSIILQPRVVGSKNHDKIADFIKNELDLMGFTTEVDQFSEEVPHPKFKKLTFKNIIGKLNPNAEKFLVLACHYDSKYFPDNLYFVGAIDSAVPCAINLNIAKVLLPYLQNLKDRSDISLMLIFFDGEEAFVNWDEKDSIYGSRHLAKKMANSVSVSKTSNRNVREIDNIEILILLDLIGARNSKFYNFYPNTEILHFGLVNIERSLGKEGLLEGNRNYQFMSSYAPGYVDDDHRPFLRENVPILHLITMPFPKQWHKKDDTYENLDNISINNFNKVLRIFVYEYLKSHTKDVNFRI